jgi:hypothetical protein
LTAGGVPDIARFNVARVLKRNHSSRQRVTYIPWVVPKAICN